MIKIFRISGDGEQKHQRIWGPRKGTEKQQHQTCLPQSTFTLNTYFHKEKLIMLEEYKDAI